MISYTDFLQSKLVQPRASGITVPRTRLNRQLFEWQKDIVLWALDLGRAAIFADCGLGKTPMQLDWARTVAKHAKRPVIILAPLAVAHQTKREGEKFGIPVTVCRSQADVAAGINITNYEMLSHFTPDAFAGVVLDESSILKSYSGTVKMALQRAFANTPFRLCCTATPAPNDVEELGNHAEFLGLMEAGEMLTRWFINDTTLKCNFRLKHHAERPFWQWVASWAKAIEKPSDLGYPDDGFALPALRMHEHIIGVDHRPQQLETGRLFHAGNLSATELHREMRRTASDRADKVAELVNNSSDAWIVWCHTNYEADALLDRVADAVEVRGGDNHAEEKLTMFSGGRARVIITKPSIAGFGLNWQHCHNVAFVGLSYSYEQFYQALRRSWRFGQTTAVDVHVICAESEGAVLATIREKETAHAGMKAAMHHALANQAPAKDYAVTADIAQAGERGDDWTLYLGDCVEAIADMPADSIHFTIFSPPFSNLYMYTESLRDMGNSADDSEFFEHFAYLVPQLSRVTVPGRLCAVHTKDLPMYKTTHGVAGYRDFTGDVIRAMSAGGWVYHSRITIQTDPVQEMQRTKSNGLLYKTIKRDASYSRQGAPEYLVIFRRWNGLVESAEPVLHTPDDFPLERWQVYANPVWSVREINRTNVLNVQIARDDQDEKHLAPLQLDVIKRAIELWTNPGDLILDPFSGVGSTGFQALKMNRRFFGVELKPSYYRTAVANLKRAATERGQATLFTEEETTA